MKGLITLITKEKLNRINELSRKKRSVGLNDEETAEQKQLHREYIENIKGQVINLLDRIEFVDKDPADAKKNEQPKQHATTFQQTHIYLGQRLLH